MSRLRRLMPGAQRRKPVGRSWLSSQNPGGFRRSAQLAAVVQQSVLRVLFVAISALIAQHSAGSASCADEPKADAPAELSVSDWQQRLHDGTRDDRRQAAIATRSCSPDMQRQLLPEFIELLRHETDGQIRLAMLDTLTDMGPAAEPAGPALVNAMLRDFGGRFDEERHQDYRAALALAAIGEPAVELLRNLLTEESPHLRAEAAMALGRIGPAASVAVSDLIPLLADEQERVRVDVIRALAVLAPSNPDAVLTAAESENAVVRSGAVAALGRSGVSDDRIRRVVAAAGTDDVPAVRAAGLRAAGSLDIPTETLAERVINGLQDEDETVRVAAVNVAHQRPEVLNHAQSDLFELLRHPDNSVSRCAAILLSRGGPGVADQLLEAAHDERCRVEQLSAAIASIDGLATELLYEKMHDPRLRVARTAALALGDLRPVKDTTVEGLAELLTPETEDALLRDCLLSLHQLGPRARPTLQRVRQLAQHSDPSIRRHVADVLSVSAPRDQRLVEDLAVFLNDSDPGLRQHTVALLLTVGPPGQAAINSVTKLLDDPDGDVQRAAVQFLGSHGAAAAASVQRLTSLVEGSDAANQIAVLDTLGRIGPAAVSAVPQIMESLHHASPQVREAGLRALVRLDLELEPLREPLLMLLQDENDGVRYQAARSIRQFGETAVRLLPDLIRLSTDETAGESITELLERLERYPVDAETAAQLVELTANENGAVQRLGIRFLGLAESSRATAEAAIRPYLEHADESLRMEATAALERIRGENSESVDND